MALLLLLLAVSLGLILATLKWYRDRKNLGIPGPWGVPIFHNLLDLVRNSHRFYDWSFDYTMKYGRVWAATAPRMPWDIMVIDPADVNHILKGNFDNYIKSENFQEVFMPFLGEGIFNVNGANWKQQRQTASHLFKVKELRNMIHIFVHHGHEFLGILKDNEGQIIDTQDFFARFTLDSFAEIAFGKVVGSLKQPVAFSEAFNSATRNTDLRFAMPWWRVQNAIQIPSNVVSDSYNISLKWTPWLPSEKALRKAVAVLDDFAYKVIEERKRDPKLAESTDLLSRYLNMTDDEGKPFSDKYLRDIIMNFMIAGRDTTAQTLTWLFYLLSQNTDKREKLISEIDSTLAGELPTYDNVHQLKYLQAAIDETLRLYPSVPFDGKHAIKDDQLPSGYKIPAGADVSYSPWAMGRHPDFWDSPLEFRPERWFGENGGKEVPKVGTIPFMPFNYGPRTCLGQKMAYLEVKVLSSMILQKFVLDLQPGHKVTYQPAVTISVLNGMKMIPTRRQTNQ